MIDSTKIKYALLQHYGFKKGFYCCTELSYPCGIADVFCVDKHNKEAIDIEVKISKQDFLNDFLKKEFKHQMFRNLYDKKLCMERYPNKFYFCVPSTLTEFVVKTLKERKLNWYGVIEFNEVYINGHLDLDQLLKTIQPAKKMFAITEQSCTKIKEWMLNRLRNDCIGFYREKVYGNRYGKIEEIK